MAPEDHVRAEQENAGPSKEWLAEREREEKRALEITYFTNWLKDYYRIDVKDLNLTEAQQLRDAMSRLIQIGFFNK